jgi:hypothetical protein
MQRVIEGYKRLNITATNASLKGGGVLGGIFVASTTSGTIKVEDTSGTIVNTFTPAAATYYPIPTEWTGTLTITIANTLDCTVFYSK